MVVGTIVAPLRRAIAQKPDWNGRSLPSSVRVPSGKTIAASPALSMPSRARMPAVALPRSTGTAPKERINQPNGPDEQRRPRERADLPRAGDADQHGVEMALVIAHHEQRTGHAGTFSRPLIAKAEQDFADGPADAPAEGSTTHAGERALSLAEVRVSAAGWRRSLFGPHDFFEPGDDFGRRQAVGGNFDRVVGLHAARRRRGCGRARRGGAGRRALRRR